MKLGTKSLWLVFLLAIGMIVAAAPLASAEIYRWTDSKGGEHFSMDLAKVPPKYRAAAKASAGRVGKNANINVIKPIQRPDRQTDPTPRTLSRPAQPTRLGQPASARHPRPADNVEKAAGRPESYWREQVERYTNEIQSLETQIDACKDIKVPRRTSSSGRRVKRKHREEKMSAVQRCGKKKSTLTARKRQLKNFLETARRQGVPPGWLRTY